MLISKIILSASVTCLLFSPIMVITIPTAIPGGIVSVSSGAIYALDFAGGGILGPDNFEDLTYFSFYTFFKCGDTPDCIDLITDDDFNSNVIS